MKLMFNVYFAGKISKGGDYRGSLLSTSDSRVMSYLNKEYDLGDFVIRYKGPLALSCDHGCFHKDGNSHGVNSDFCTGNYDDYDESCFDEDVAEQISIEGSTSQGQNFIEETFQRCYKQIKSSCLFYARIDSLDCYGTLMEIGIARTLKIPILLSINPEIDHENLWFIKQTTEYIEYTKTPTWDLLKLIR